ncbi:hypothetical protein H310_05075 [Aphanomyces invadans]|uniref:Core-binding (CB) domain-containing protein n=1 Tax=Aphanomyces invadans TaxID=157072 RepID=A0A024UBN6_9STRA|nr:hypothetical protein H310_05075 [Aphanomyces invadans]ETW03689.1 hypothetical protein H310_05075 [Aphanomyces invadans]|eukprot:XP_008867918.1 hypothetical protein H310_05075 [Aphanomyces invadans]
MTDRQETTLDDIRNSRLSNATKLSYASGMRRIYDWINTLSQMERDRMLSSDGTISIVGFTYHDFPAFIVLTLSARDIKVATMSGYRSAIKDYYKQHNTALPSGYDTDMKDLFQGMHRLKATAEQSSSIKDSGKRHLKFGHYQALALASVKANDGGFQHLFLVLSWNLMARSKSTETVQLDHLTLEGDALGVTFYKTKTDQTGSKRRDPKHLYANPLNPSICVFLAFAIHFASNVCLTDGPLFVGSNQRTRFGKGLRSIVKSGELGTTEDIGTHSVRKGAATYVCSGSTAGPSIISVCLRCGWSLGNVVERYMHYEKAGDQFVGRTVAGLPLNKADFAVLPPHFTSNSDATVDDTVMLLFPVLSAVPKFVPMLRLFLASLVQHSGWLKSHLPPKHALLHTALFADPSRLERLVPLVATASTLMQPTGLPPYVEIFSLMEASKTSVDAVKTSIDNIAPSVIAGVQGLLDDRDFASGVLTPAHLHSTLETTVTRFEASMRSIVGYPVPAQPLSAEASTTPSHAIVRQLYTWGGGMHRVPEAFSMPLVDTATAWSLWWGSINNTVPYRSLTPSDLAAKNDKRILSEWLLVMSFLTAAYREAMGCSCTASCTAVDDSEGS